MCSIRLIICATSWRDSCKPTARSCWPTPAAKPAADAIEQFSGPALHGLIRSQTLRPAAWKIEALSKARAYYHGYWLKKKNLRWSPSTRPRSPRPSLLTRDRDFAEFIFVMNDWLCTLQYREVDAQETGMGRRLMPWVDGQTGPHAPDIRSALAAQSLADACRVAQAAEDWPRFKRYKKPWKVVCSSLPNLAIH